MRRPLAPVLAAAALLLQACATAPKLPAIPPPLETAPSASQPAQPAPTAWYEPFRTDGTWEERRFGVGVLKARYPLTDDTIPMKIETVTSTGQSTKGTLHMRPITGDFLAAYFTASVGYYGFGMADATMEAVEGRPFPVKMYGLYEGVRVPITLVDFKGPDVQLLLVPGMTAQVLYYTGENDAGTKIWGLVAGGSLNGAGVGVAVGDWLVVEADFWKWGWTYVDQNKDFENGSTQTGSFSGFCYGVAPVFYTRVLF